MHTPSGRFKCSERLCLSISDFHPKSFNPAWEVSTILLGVLSFMTSEEITTGSIKASESERKVYAYRTRWWNSTGGGSTDRTLNGLPAHKRAGFGAIKAGDGGKRFREEWPEEDAENWKWMQENEIDPQTGAKYVAGGHDANGTAQSAAGTSVESPTASAVEKAASEAKNAQSWFARNKMYVIGGVLFVYVAAARLLRDHQEYS
jgi:ubiquitin-conjugating enzyme E2 J2